MMGIRNFQHFCKVDVPNSFKIISILEELEKYKSATGKDPVIIINLKTIISQFQVNNRDVLCGNRMNIIKRKIDYFFSTLQEAGAKLIFPIVKMTPNVSEEDDKHWQKSMEKNYKECMKFIDEISNSTSLDQLADIYDEKRVHEFVHPFSFSFPIYAMLLDVAMKYGQLIGFEYSGRFFDPLFDILELAIKYDVFAIINFDSNYLLYEGTWKYWSNNLMDIDNMKIIEYDKESILQYLKLTYEMIPLFNHLACLGEFKETDLDQELFDAMKRKFHCGRKRFFKVAEFVSGQKFPLTFSGLQDIARSILGQNQPSRRNFISELQKGLREFYGPKSPKNDFEGLLVDALHSGNSFAFEFLMGSNISLVPAYTASEFPGIKPFQDLITQIMRKSAGILMKDYEDKKLEVSVVIKNTDGEFVDRKDEVIWPEFDVPGIAEMLNGDITDDFKIKTLIYLTDLEVSEDLLKSVPDNQLMVLITLTYLIKKETLTKSEACMILQVLHAEKMQIIEENIQYPEVINVRGFHVTILTSNFFRYFQYCCNSVGFKMQKFEFDFDAVYYQNLLANNNDNSLEASSDASDAKVFEELTNYCKSLE